MLKWIFTLAASGLLVGCCGQGERQVRRLEHLYGKPRSEIFREELAQKQALIDASDKEASPTGGTALK